MVASRLQGLGGQAFAAKGLTVFVAVTDIRQGDKVAVIALALVGAAFIGLMAVVNFVIRSDFRWMLLGAAALWAAAIAIALVT